MAHLRYPTGPRLCLRRPSARRGTAHCGVIQIGIHVERDNSTRSFWFHWREWAPPKKCHVLLGNRQHRTGCQWFAPCGTQTRYRWVRAQCSIHYISPSLWVPGPMKGMEAASIPLCLWIGWDLQVGNGGTCFGYRLESRCPGWLCMFSGLPRPRERGHRMRSGSADTLK